MTAALWSTVISPLSTPTWWPSLVMFSASQAAILRVWNPPITAFVTDHRIKALALISDC